MKNTDFSIVAAVSNDKILENNLLQSPILKNGKVPFHPVRDAVCAGIAYNQGLQLFLSKRFIVFAHQDVYIPKNWHTQAIQAIESLENKNILWGVLGLYGKKANGHAIGRVWDSGFNRELGHSFGAPQQVQSLDELLLIINPKAPIAFDNNLPGFHLFGADICACAHLQGYQNYVIDAPVVHNSRRVRSLGGSYALAYSYLQKKWRAQLPIQAVCSPITPWGIRYKRIRFGLAYRRYLGLIPQQQAGVRNPVELAVQQGYE